MGEVEVVTITASAPLTPGVITNYGSGHGVGYRLTPNRLNTVRLSRYRDGTGDWRGEDGHSRHWWRRRCADLIQVTVTNFGPTSAPAVTVTRYGCQQPGLYRC
jgi:hypothetical protein